jgi:hypothetical protein
MLRKNIAMTLFQSKRPTDFACPAEKIQISLGFLYGSSTSGLEPSHDRKCAPQSGDDSDGADGQFNVPSGSKDRRENAVKMIGNQTSSDAERIAEEKRLV